MIGNTLGLKAVMMTNGEHESSNNDDSPNTGSPNKGISAIKMVEGVRKRQSSRKLI